MSDKVTKLEELFVELGAEAFLQDQEARMLVDTDPECAAIVSALDEVDTMVSQLPVPDAPAFDAAALARAHEKAVAEWYVAVDDEQVGPLGVEEVKQRIREGTLDSECLAWKPDMRDWEPIGDIEEFASLLPATTNHKPLDKLAEEAAPKVAGAPIEWKPAAAEQLTSLVDEEIHREKEQPEPEPEPELQDMPELSATPAFVVPGSSRISWTPPEPATKKLRPWHLILGGLGSSFATAAVILLALHFTRDAPPKAVADAGGPVNKPPAAGAVPEKPAGSPEKPTEAKPPAAKPVEAIQPAPPPPSPSSAPARDTKRKRKGGGASGGMEELLESGGGAGGMHGGRRRNHGGTLKGALEGTGAIPESATTAKPDKPALEKSDIMNGVKKGMGAVMGCIKTARANGELAPGRHTLVLEWTIQPNGRVANPKVKGPAQVLGTSLPGCFARGMRKWRFPSTEKGAPVRNFPFGPFNIK